MKRFTELLKVIGRRNPLTPYTLLTHTLTNLVSVEVYRERNHYLKRSAKSLVSFSYQRSFTDQRSCIEKFDIAKHFQTIAFERSERCQARCNIFKITLDKLGHKDLNSTIMIGDSLSSDIAGAENLALTLAGLIQVIL